MKKIKTTIKNTIFVIGLISIIATTILFYYEFSSGGLGVSSVKFLRIKSTIKAEIDESLITQRPKNIIIFIADGMGFGHLSLSMALKQSNEKQIWNQFTSYGWHKPHPVSGFLIDSAASANALATGFPTWNGVVGLEAENFNSIENLFEYSSANGYKTGIVTDSYIWDATPAAFIAHTKSRKNAEEVLKQISTSQLDLLFGELEDLGEGDAPDEKTTLELLQKRFTLLDESLNFRDIPNDQAIAAIFDEDQIYDLQSNPNLTSMVSAALNRLTANQYPFVLLIESEEVDSASHEHDDSRLKNGLLSIESSLKKVIEFAKHNKDTLVIFTSDHETGGLVLGSSVNNKQIRSLWTTPGHTGSVVPLMSFGPGSQYFSGIFDTEEVGVLLKVLVNTEH